MKYSPCIAPKLADHRLPLPSLLRCSLVCKAWYYLSIGRDADLSLWKIKVINEFSTEGSAPFYQIGVTVDGTAYMFNPEKSLKTKDSAYNSSMDLFVDTPTLREDGLLTPTESPRTLDYVLKDNKKNV